MSLNHQRVSALALAEPSPHQAEQRRIDHGAVERAARDLLRELEPKGVGVVLEAEHMCNRSSHDQ